MKLRYYMRGLGIGIIVVVLLMMLTGNDSKKLTDAQIRERAIELGMVDTASQVLTDLAEPEGNKEIEEKEDVEEKDTEETIEETIEDTIEDTETSSEVTKPSEISDVEDPTEQTEPSEDTVEPSEAEGGEEITEATEEEPEEATEEMDSAEEYVTITIASGSGSESVCRLLENNGLIDNASSYDKYLCDNGYSKSIRVGTYEIKVGSTYEEIAKIITGKR